ncbi:efflux RND transporter periplasmic adaptor subunit [Loktanella sp. M215]|uniref:efflux RND transporter periplasmic adaptor subunit n=1 Tax=Loktanella sp. M215 TaxID=2675431 RepID=UPI001F010164|nr:efflux RND transporter periplasmic adaptor subunit [Loktanella sp. M215]MCF7699206.1 efflux RND transporter periplasmic adaptor subunit [Loktanella sp. M215]
MSGRYAALSILALGVGLAGGISAERFYFNRDDAMADTGPDILYWVAPMDANFRKDGPGKSPMGMDLIPVYAGDAPAADPSTVTLSPAEINAIGVRTAVATAQDISQTIQTVGYVGYDEHLTSHVHTRVEGWIEDLKVRAIGDRVAKDELLFSMFSPEIGSASADHIRALEDGNRRIIEISRNRLRSVGMSDRQIEEVEATREIARNLSVYAPQDGVVIGIEAADGMYLQPNTRAVSLTDLATVWLVVDVFERDIDRLTDDMTAAIRFDHMNGRVFEGRVDYIYPELDAKTRTLPVRLVVDNAEGLLKPNMFASVALSPGASRLALTVPTEAIIRTGSAERVILKTGEGTFAPRLITTGLRDDFDEGGRTEVVQGLAAGDEVVASAQFLIDSESALSAGLMRMAPTDAAPAKGVGTLVAFDTDTRTATIRHGALDGIGWPAMTTDFPVRADVAVDDATTGQDVAFQIARGAGGLLYLSDLGRDDGIAATGTGVVEAVTADGKLTMNHDPIPDLGWPAMVMDMPVMGVDTAAVTVGTPVNFDLVKDGDTYVIVGVRPVDDAMQMEMPETTAATPDPTAAPITVAGTIDAVDIASRRATITHGNIAETGMPGMTMDFDLTSAVDPATLPVGVETTLTFDRPDGMTMVLAQVAAPEPPMEVSGTINAVDPATGMANITHGPMVDIGMPGMTMDFAVAPTLAAGDLPTGQDMTLLMTRNADFSLTLVGVANDPQVRQ